MCLYTFATNLLFLKTLYRSKFILSVLTGTIIYLTLFGFRSFYLTNIEWLKDQSDFTMNYVGWSFYRSDSWTFPLTKTLSLGYPVGSSVVYTDSVPLFAFLFKFISPWLPENFQYFPIWVLLITIAQVYAAIKIFSFFIKDEIVVFAGALLLVVCPVFMVRAFWGNIGLGSHFILLLEIYIFLAQRKKQRFEVLPWIVLLVLSTIIHPQLTLIGYLIFFGHLAGLFVSKMTTLRECLFSIAKVVAVTVITGYIFGVIDPGVKAQGSGFGYYTFNFNSFFNPMYLTVNIGIRLSQNGNGQGDGQSYLGAGLFACLVPFVVYLIKTNKGVLFFSKKYVSYHIIFLVGAAIACAGNISFGSHQIIYIPIPHSVANVLSFARASARFIWPLYYILYIYLVVFSFRLLQKRKWVARAFLIAVLALQIIDLYPFFPPLKDRFEMKADITTPELKHFLKQTSFVNKHIFLYPTDKSYYNTFAFEALDNKQTQNAAYFTRDQTNIAIYADRLIEDILKHGTRVDSTILVLKNKNLPILIDSLHPGTYDFFRIQNFDIAVAANAQITRMFPAFAFKPQKLTENDFQDNSMITVLYNSDDFSNICGTTAVIKKLNEWCPKNNWGMLYKGKISNYGSSPDSLISVLAAMKASYFGTAVSKRRGRTVEVHNQTFYIASEKSFIIKVPVEYLPYKGISLYY